MSPSVEPFDEVKYKALMDGLECSEVLLSNLEAGYRFDSELYQKQYVVLNQFAKTHECTTFNNEASLVSKGIFSISASCYTETGIPFVRISNIKNMLISQDDIVYIPEQEHAKHGKTRLVKGDIVLSKTGGPAAAYVDMNECNVSQDTVGIKLKKESKILSEYAVVYLNCVYGIAQMKKRFTGNVQMHLNLDDCKNNVIIPVMTNSFQKIISDVFHKGLYFRNISNLLFKKCKDLLDDVLIPSKKTTDCSNFAQKKLSVTLGKTGRLDAEYYQEIYEQYNKSLYTTETVNSLCSIHDGTFEPKEGEDYRYIELSNVGFTGGVSDVETMRGEELPSRARRKVSAGQIVISSIEGSLQNCALITDDFDDCLCSTGFYVLDSSEINSETLLVLFKSEAIQALMKQRCSGTILTAISKDELLSMPLPRIDAKIQKDIATKIQESFALRRQSKQLLEYAKQAVEMAIEQGEDIAFAWLEDKISGSEI